MGGLFVDYIQLVGAPEGRFESREAEIKAIAKDIKLAAVRADCPVLVAAQIDREVAKLADWIPEGTLEGRQGNEGDREAPPAAAPPQANGGGDQEADLVIGILNYQADFLAALEDAEIDPRPTASKPAPPRPVRHRNPEEPLWPAGAGDRRAGKPHRLSARPGRVRPLIRAAHPVAAE